MKNILDSSIGMAEITVRGLSLERFLNTATSSGAEVKNVRKVKQNEIHFYANALNYYKLVSNLPKGSYAFNSKKSGMAFYAWRMRKRFVLLIGISLVIISIILCFTKVWFIKVNGNESISTAGILEKLAVYGVNIGSNVTGELLEECEQKLLQDFPKLRFVGLTREGININVFIKEKAKEPLPSIREPADIIALKDGIISNVTAIKGKATVKSGQTVQKGTVLISGLIEYTQAEPEYVNATGIVTARVWYKSEQTFLKEKKTVEKTGKVVKCKSIVLFGKEIPITREQKPNTYILEENKSYSSYIGLPLQIIDRYYYETNEKIENIDKNLLIEQQSQDMIEKLKTSLQKNTRISDQGYTYEENDKQIALSVFVEVIEEIGIIRPCK